MLRARLFRRIGVVVSLSFLVGLLAVSPTLPSFAQQATPEAEGTPEASPVASPVAETGPHIDAFVAGNFRVAVVAAIRAEAISDSGVDLTAREDRDWIVVIADVSNWSTRAANLRVRDFAIRLTGGAEPRGFASRSTELSAAALGMEPAAVNDGVRIGTGDTTRVALVFQIDRDGANPALYYINQALPLATTLANTTSLANLPPVTEAPELEVAAVDDAPDGATLTLANGGGTVQLAGIEPPLPEECFGGQSASRLKRLAGDEVMLETAADGSTYVWAEQRSGSRKLLNAEMLSTGFAAVLPGTTGSYVAWMTDSEETARTSLAGLWGSCTALHGVSRTEGPERSVLNVSSGETNETYRLWGFLSWAPTLVTTPDGGAWAFFSAQADDGPEKDLGKLYASQYDPSTGSWSAATPLPGGEFQFGASAVVDDRGLVHVVYSDQERGEAGVFAVLMYIHEDGSGGWTDPVPVAASDDAGHQIAPSLSIDASGTLHVLWQDQRLFSAEARSSSTLNADIFASDLPPGGEWSEPVPVNEHFPTSVGTWPNVVVDGDRLVAVWSVYTSATGANTAARIDWATRPLDDPDGWSASEPLVVGRGEQFGARFVDLAADPNGGVVMAFARQLNDAFLFVRRLAPESNEWGGDVLITAGLRGTYPSIAVSNQGIVYIVYNVGGGDVVDVGAAAIPFRSIQPGPERLLTQDDPNSQGLAVVTTDQNGAPWVVYFSQTPGQPANKAYVLRNAEIPTGT
jgi:endonuclease YncB( thermonuclease family)